MSPQSSIGHYRIISKLGAGGMGEVYRATDTKLERDVAIKVLPDSFAQDPARMARFEREAKVLASLNHPNIATIYGVEERALVMELVEGPTLNDRIALGAIPLEEAMALARQIADGLEAAHERGIVHRDLKPANIKVTPDGKVKVLDFGLATAAEEEQASNADISPTLTMRQTQLGVILGTAGYMAPEQARGKRVDKKADIWAFGVVFYEMLAGRRLFDGEDVTTTLAAVVMKEPDWNAVPPEVRRLLRGCLEKDPKKRLRDIGDVWRLLDEETTSVEPPPQALADARSYALWVAAGLAVVLAAALGFVGYRHFTEETRLLKFSVLLPDKARFTSISGPAVSPDGRRVAIALTVSGQRALWVRDLDSLSARMLPGTDGAALPFWSPDSRWVAFFGPGKLKKIEVAGGPAIPLCDVITGRGGTWNQNDVIVYAANGGLFRVPGAGGSPTPLTTPDKAASESNHHTPWFLPDGRHFLYTAGGGIAAAGVDSEKSRVYVADLESKNSSRDRREILAAYSNVVYASGYLLFLRERTLMAQRFNAATLKTEGDAVSIAEQVDFDPNPGVGFFSASQTSVLAYMSGYTRAVVHLTWFDRTGQPAGTVGDPGEIQWAQIAPDGNTVAFDRRDPQTGLSDIWTHDLVHDTESRFTFGPSSNHFPVWSADGSHIAFLSRRDGQGNIYQRATGGAAQDEVLDKDARHKRPNDISSDGRFLLEETSSPGDIWVLPLAGDRKPYPYVHTEFAEGNARLSPDGHWLAYRSNASKRPEIYVVTFPNPGRQWQISTGGGTEPIWSRDGKELYFISADQKLMAVEIRGGAKFERGTPKPLFDVKIATDGWYSVSKDGRFLIPTQLEQAATVPLTVAANWQVALNRK